MKEKIKKITTIYSVQIKERNGNKNCWNTNSTFGTLKEAEKKYSFYKSGCCKRILKEQVITKRKVVKYKKY